MVHSPVGARCPSCASIGRPSSLIVTPVDLAKAIAVAVIYGTAIGIAIGFVIGNILGFRLGGLILTVISGALIFVAGAPAGELVRRVTGNKIDKRIRYIAAFSVLVVFLAFGITTWQIFQFTLAGQILVIAGLILGAIVAMRRAS